MSLSDVKDLIEKYIPPFNPQIHSTYWYSDQAILINLKYLHAEGSIEAEDVERFRDAGVLL